MIYSLPITTDDAVIRCRIGDNVTIHGQLPHFDNGQTVTCKDNQGFTLFRIVGISIFHTEKAKRKVQAYIDPGSLSIKLTLINITPEDAGSYTCEQPGGLNETRIVFVWGECTKKGPCPFYTTVALCFSRKGSQTESISKENSSMHGC